jgi:hypothetical protein
MTIHLLIIGQRPEGAGRLNDADIEGVAALTANGATSAGGFVVRRCMSTKGFAKIVYEVALEYGPISTLDLYDHGAQGYIRMGNGVLFDADGTGSEIAQQIQPLLAAHAQVRLLSCESAVGEAGRALLRSLQGAFGGSIVVYGTIGTVSLRQFNRTGFIKKNIEEQYLFSSTAAAKDIAPRFNERRAELINWANTQRKRYRDHINESHTEPRS